MKSIRYYFDHWRISLIALTITALSMGTLSLGLTSFQASTKAAPAQTRDVRVVGADAIAGQRVNISIVLTAQGDENTVKFSLNFDPAVFSGPMATLGSGAPQGSTLIFDASQATSGSVGITVAAPTGQVFAAGAQQIAIVSFAVVAPAPAAPSQITEITKR